MIKWRMTSVVEAGKILKISHVNRESVRPDAIELGSTECMQLTVATEKGTEDVFVDYYYFNRYEPAIGGHFLRYPDGWCGYASEEVFKRRFQEENAYGECAKAESSVSGLDRGVISNRSKQTRSTR